MKASRSKTVLKAVWASQPLNWIVTSALRACMRTARVESRFVSRYLRPVGTVSDRLPNGRVLRLTTRDDDLLANRVFWGGWSGYEPETVPLFFELARNAGTTLDIGSHVGIFSLLAGHANPRGRVFAFEPMSRIFQRLSANVRLNGLENVECIHSAVGDRVGTADLFYDVDYPLPDTSSFHAVGIQMTSPRGVLVPTLGKVAVDVTTVDRFVEERGIARVDLIKVDTEGAECGVLQGMIQTIERDHPIIICEVLERFGTARRIEEILEPYGYRYYLLTADGPKLRDRIDGQPEGNGECRNFLFTTHPLA